MLNDVKGWLIQHKEWAIALVLIGALGLLILIHRLRNAQSAGSQTSTPVSPIQNVPIVGNGFTQGGIDGTQGSILPPVVVGSNQGTSSGGSSSSGSTSSGGGATASPKFYTAVSSDTLQAIADRFNLPLQQLYSMNPFLGTPNGYYVSGGNYNPNQTGNVSGLNLRVG